MNFKYIFTLFAFLLLGLVANAQKLQKDINLLLSRDRSHIRSADLFAGNVIIHVSQSGNVNLDVLPNTQYAYADPLNTPDGKFSTMDHKQISYYDGFAQSNSGKIKSIGNLVIAYYDQYDGFDNIGRVKNIGSIAITYYTKYDGVDNIGKIKSIGDVVIKYNDRYDGFDNTGKIKSIGNIIIQYYDRYNASEKMGKIKSITGRTPNITIDGLSDEDLANAAPGF